MPVMSRRAPAERSYCNLHAYNELTRNFVQLSVRDIPCTQPKIAWTPRLRPIHAQRALLHNDLPRPLTALVGRRKRIAFVSNDSPPTCAGVPAVVLRGAYSPDHCRDLMRRFEQRGYFDPATVGQASQLSGGPYLDLGTSLGRLGADPAAFFAHAARTHELFATLFEGFADPVRTMYSTLSDLAEGKVVFKPRVNQTGGSTSPAIFRMYHAAEGHKPHYDSVAKRSRSRLRIRLSATSSANSAGVLCLQTGDDASADEPFIYRCWGTQPQVEEVLRQDRFAEYAAEHRIPRSQVRLTPGDLYFFCTENIHEVAAPDPKRQRRRVVLAFELRHVRGQTGDFRLVVE